MRVIDHGTYELATHGYVILRDFFACFCHVALQRRLVHLIFVVILQTK